MGFPEPEYLSLPGGRCYRYDVSILDAPRRLQASKPGNCCYRVNLHDAERSSTASCETSGAAENAPNRRAVRVELHGLLRRAIQRLPESDRSVVQMYYLDSRPVEEVSEKRRRSSGAVYMAPVHWQLREILGHRSRFLSA